MKSIIELITVVCVAAIGSNAPPPLLAASPSPSPTAKKSASPVPKKKSAARAATARLRVHEVNSGAPRSRSSSPSYESKSIPLGAVTFGGSIISSGFVSSIASEAVALRLRRR
jgi:hypothetical protein